MKNEILSFNGRVNIAYNIVKEQYPEVELVEAYASSGEEPTVDPYQLLDLECVFEMGDGSVFIRETGYGEFGEPVYLDEPYMGVQPITWPMQAMKDLLTG